ncbi:hypothetical protein IJI31_01030 [bacterium]|nr:hypothetical protein [bacterium]
MQDRFKFRVWNIETKEMLLVYSFDKNFIQATQDYVVPSIRRFNTNDCILMQCTGLKDTNEKLIYEGDIVTYICDSDYCSDGYHKCLYCSYGEKAEIIFDDSSAMFKYSSIRDECPLDDNIDTEINLEVIGNIYENKELLNEIHS